MCFISENCHGFREFSEKKEGLFPHILVNPSDENQQNHEESCHGFGARGRRSRAWEKIKEKEKKKLLFIFVAIKKTQFLKNSSRITVIKSFIGS